MAYQVVFKYSDGFEEDDDEIFETEEEAEEYGEARCESYGEGCRSLEMMNPGEYGYDEDEICDYEVIEIIDNDD